MDNVNENFLIHQKRISLDDLLTGSVIWSPYDKHIPHMPIDLVCLYSGSIRHSSMVHPHLSKWVLMWFDGIQKVLTLLPFEKPSCEDTSRMFAAFSSHTVKGDPSQYPSQTSQDYMGWYKRVSHPVVVPPDRRYDEATTLAITFCLVMQIR